MLRFLADEDFDHRILRGLELREPALDVLTVQDAGRSGEEDPANLDFAAKEERVLLTHDKRLIGFVLERVESGKRMAGVFVVHQDSPIGQVVEDLLDLALFSIEGEWEGQVVFVPLTSTR